MEGYLSGGGAGASPGPDAKRRAMGDRMRALAKVLTPLTTPLSVTYTHPLCYTPLNALYTPHMPS